MSKDQNQMVSGIIGSMSWDLGSLFASKLQQKFMSKDQNQMVRGIKGRLSWDLGSLFASKLQQKFMSKDQNQMVSGIKKGSMSSLSQQTSAEVYNPRTRTR
jgi:hypothetical protein